MIKSRDKQLTRLEIGDVMKRRRLDQALNMKQFAIAAGISYSAAQEWFRQPGFPIFCRVTFWSDFVEWRRSRVGLKAAAPPIPLPDDGSDYKSKYKSSRLKGLAPRTAHMLAESARPDPPPPHCYPQSRAEYLASLPPKARRILEEIG